jgi:hypothetical protein
MSINRDILGVQSDFRGAYAITANRWRLCTNTSSISERLPSAEHSGRKCSDALYCCVRDEVGSHHAELGIKHTGAFFIEASVYPKAMVRAAVACSALSNWDDSNGIAR